MIEIHSAEVTALVQPNHLVNEEGYRYKMSIEKIASMLNPRNRLHGLRRRCQNHSYGTRIVEVIEPRILMTVYSIDPVRGDDSNPGTLDLPFRTPRNLSYSTAEGNENSVQLEAGDTVYLREGLHDWSTLLTDIPNTDNAGAAFLVLGVHGTASAPITIRAYPNERPVVTGKESGIENTLIYVLQSSHIKILGLEVTGAFGNGIQVTETQEVEIAYNHVHDNDGLARNNLAGIYTVATIGLSIHDNLVHDNYDREGARINDDTIYLTSNSRNIVVFGDESDRVVVHHNKVFNTPLPNGATTGAGIWVKHASEIPGATLQFHNNIVRDVFHAGIGGQSPGIEVRNNLIINAGSYLLGGGDNLLTKQLTLERIKIDHNTFFNTNPVEIHSLDTFNYPEAGFMEFRSNIITTSAQSYNSENGILRLDVYGTDDEYHALVTPQNLQFSDNVYYNAPVAPVWSVFSANGGEYGVLGKNYTFPQWQALGIDTTSIVANPGLNSDFVPQNSAALNAGWLAGSDPRLAMYMQNNLIRESDGQNAAFITMYRTGSDLSKPLTVALSVSDSSELSIPETAIFPVDIAVIHVPISTVADGKTEPTRGVQIFASTTTGLKSSEWVRVLQDSAAAAAFDAAGTSGSDTFVVRYSGNTPNSSVTVAVVTNGGTARRLGTFPMSTALNLKGLGGSDSVRVVGSALNDRIVVNNALVAVNGSKISLNSIEQKTLAAGTGNDTYRFDTDGLLGAFSLIEYGAGGVDTIDFSSTTTRAVALSLSSSTAQVVNSNMRLTLSSGRTFENLVGGLKSDTLTGNAFNNSLRGGAGDDILVGLSGNDRLYGDDGRDLVVGGRGLDRLFGGSNDDILISGFTTSDTGVGILHAIRKEWNSKAAYAVRISRLRRGVPGVLLKAKVNVLNDTPNRDILSGGSGNDWYFKAIDDSITDFFTGETLDVL